MARIAAASVGVIALFCVYEAAEHGGELVYSYAGGVGIRSGDPKDVERLLLAGLYHQSLQDRKAGNREQAAELVALAARRFPADIEVRLLAAESLLIDQRNVAGGDRRAGRDRSAGRQSGPADAARDAPGRCLRGGRSEGRGDRRPPADRRGVSDQRPPEGAA